MKAIILFFLVFFIYTCSAQEKNLSYEIYKKQAEQFGDKEYLKILEHNRNRIGWIDKIKNLENDTIYIIEKDIYGIEASQKYIISSMWQKGKDSEGIISLKINSYYQANIDFKESNEIHFSSLISPLLIINSVL